MKETPQKVWRLRMKFDARQDLAKEAWEHGEAGFWYGGWSAKDWNAVCRLPGNDRVKQLGAINRVRGCPWDVKKSWVDTASSFVAISSTEPILVIFDGTIHLGRLEGPLRSSPDHRLNREDQLFKYRKVSELKKFALSELPDSFRLLPSAGRNALHGYHDSNQFLADLLLKSSNAREVKQRFRELPRSDLLRLLGPGAWESMCLGYLIIVEDFVPTGLSVGRTLKDFDIVGVGLSSKTRILAQCKNDRTPISWRTALGAGLDSTAGDRVFLFAWGGCNDSDTLPEGVTVLDGRAIERWLTTAKGREYWDRWIPAD